MKRLPFPPSTGRVFEGTPVAELQRLMTLDRQWLTQALTDQGRLYTKGLITGEEFRQAAALMLQTSHTAAARIGTAAAGGKPDAFDSYLVGNRISLHQQGFFSHFLEDIENGRYRARSKGGKGAAARNARFDMYARRLIGTANQSWLEVIKGKSLKVRWIYGNTIEHCKTCQIEFYVGWRSPYSLERVPGDGTTACIIFCGCHLESESGLISLSLGDRTYRPKTKSKTT